MSHACCPGGPDGDRIREYNTQLQGYSGRDEPPLALPSHIPILATLNQGPIHPSPDCPSGQRASRLSPQQTHDILVRVGRESLRALAKEYGVSHETIRRVLTRKAMVTQDSFCVDTWWRKRQSQHRRLKLMLSPPTALSHGNLTHQPNTSRVGTLDGILATE